MRFHDIAITISADEVTLSTEVGGDKESKSAPLIIDPVSVLCVQRLHHWLNYSLVRLSSTAGLDKPCELADLQAIGWLLYNILFRDDKIRRLFEAAYKKFEEAYEGSNEDQPALRLRLHLILDDAPAELGALPWELLFVPVGGDLEKGFFFSGERTELILTRYSPDKKLEEELKPQPSPLKILVIWSNPSGLNIVSPDEVEKVLRQIEELEVLGLSEGSSTLSAGEMERPDAFAARLVNPADAVSGFLHGRLSDDTRGQLAAWGGDGLLPDALHAGMVKDLNEIILGNSIWEEARFEPVNVRAAIRYLRVRNPQGRDLARLNRLLLEDAFPEEMPRSRIETTLMKNPSFDQLSKAVGDLRPHIVHYIGHGDDGQLALCKDPNDPTFDSKRRDVAQPAMITGKQFKRLFANHRPRLVFLHACKGAASMGHLGLNSVARDLVNAKIPAVVAMQYSISNDDAGAFAIEFYRQLGMGQSIDEAVKAGRVILGGRYPPWEHPRFGTPVVHLMCRNAIVIPPPPKRAVFGMGAAAPIPARVAHYGGAIPASSSVTSDSVAAVPSRMGSSPAAPGMRATANAPDTASLTPVGAALSATSQPGTSVLGAALKAKLDDAATVLADTSKDAAGAPAAPSTPTDT